MYFWTISRMGVSSLAAADWLTEFGMSEAGPPVWASAVAEPGAILRTADSKTNIAATASNLARARIGKPPSSDFIPGNIVLMWGSLPPKAWSGRVALTQVIDGRILGRFADNSCRRYG